MTYILPSSTTPFPGGLTLTQFIQSILVGVTGLTATLVRPKWQLSPPKNPDVDVNWLAFAVFLGTPNANASLEMDEDGVMHSQRHQDVKIGCSFYGPDAIDYANIVTDGLQIPNNLEAMTLAGMGYASTGAMISIPDLMNERWVNRIEMEVILRREIKRVYPIVSFVEAEGTIHSVLNGQDYITSWQTPQQTPEDT